MKPKSPKTISNRWIYDAGLWIVYGLTIAFALLVVFWIAMAILKTVGWA